MIWHSGCCGWLARTLLTNIEPVLLDQRSLGLSCAFGYFLAGSARRDVFGAMVRSRVARLQERGVDESGLNWKAYEEAVGGAEQ